MFSFDGEFRRRPTQNLGGHSQTLDRTSLIEKARLERQKREKARRELNGAIVIQSWTRSFLCRCATKNDERKRFDRTAAVAAVNVPAEDVGHDTLGTLVRQLTYFFNDSVEPDRERLNFICNRLLRQAPVILAVACHDPVWLHRIKRVLLICLNQMLVARFASLELFLTMFEVFANPDAERNVGTVVPAQPLAIYLSNLYEYLMEHNYFRTAMQSIETWYSPFDQTTANPPADVLGELLKRPLSMVTSAADNPLDSKILNSFMRYVLSKSSASETAGMFAMPLLAKWPRFPFSAIVRYLAALSQPEIAQLIGGSDSDALDPRKRMKNKRDATPTVDNCQAALLHSILVLEQQHHEQIMSSNELAGSYIHVISSMCDQIKRLPRCTLSRRQSAGSGGGDSSDSDSACRRSVETPHLSPVDRFAIAEIVRLLDEPACVNRIVLICDRYVEDERVVRGVAHICHNLLLHQRWAVREFTLLYMLAFRPAFIRALWCTLASQAKGFSSPISLLSKGIFSQHLDTTLVIPTLATFCVLFSVLISTLYDGEFCGESQSGFTTHSGVVPAAGAMPFSLGEVIALSTNVKEICLGLVGLAFPESLGGMREYYRSILGATSAGGVAAPMQQVTVDPVATTNVAEIWNHLLRVCVSLLRQIYTRDLRCTFCPDNHWTVDNLNLSLDKPTDICLRRRRCVRPFHPIRDFTREDIEDGPPLSTKQLRSIAILKEIPFVVPFGVRIGVLQGLLAANKLRTQGDLQDFLQGPSIHLVVRRSHIYEDAFKKLRPVDAPDFRPRFRVQMVNSVGLEEAGIDGGGIFREFMAELVKAAFDPNRGFFMTTTDNKLYPNPWAGKLYESFQHHYYFIGRVLGKLLYENLLVELPLAEFFLNKIAGKHLDGDIHQLASLDPVLHRNLLSLKAYEGDVTELGLDFTVVCDELGQTRVTDLKANGSNIPVTATNRVEYIQLMADFKLNRQIKEQCDAFRKGLESVIPLEWLYMFSNKELQVLISGAEIPVDIDDLRHHTKYGGDYTDEHPTIQLFWHVIAEFTDDQKKQLLKFVTSCSRPPLLGFKDLDPPFCIQNSGDTDRLPSASTCMNLLKLPSFGTAAIMHEKLIYAIESSSGFELS